MDSLLDSEKKLFSYFLKWFWKEISNDMSDWLFDRTAQRIYQDGEDITQEIFQWFNIKMSKQDTSWIKEI